jgi:hypothetical protein
MVSKSKHMSNGTITVIPYNDMAYPTAGDYRTVDGVVEFKIAELESPDYEFFVLCHEVIEQYITQRRGISEESITYFDMTHPELDDPGNCPQAPYWREHTFAVRVEKLLSKELGIKWKTYDKSFSKLKWR